MFSFPGFGETSGRGRYAHSGYGESDYDPYHAQRLVERKRRAAYDEQMRVEQARRHAAIQEQRRIELARREAAIQEQQLLQQQHAAKLKKQQEARAALFRRYAKAATTIQRAWRAFSDTRHLERNNAAAAVITRCIRGKPAVVQAKTVRVSLQKLAATLEDIRRLTGEFETCATDAPPPMKMLRYYENALEKALISTDNIPTCGSEFVRATRKRLVTSAQKTLKHVDAAIQAAQETAAPASPPPPQPTETACEASTPAAVTGAHDEDGDEELLPAAETAEVPPQDDAAPPQQEVVEDNAAAAVVAQTATTAAAISADDKLDAVHAKLDEIEALMAEVFTDGKVSDDGRLNTLHTRLATLLKRTTNETDSAAAAASRKHMAAPIKVGGRRKKQNKKAKAV